MAMVSPQCAIPGCSTVRSIRINNGGPGPNAVLRSPLLMRGLLPRSSVPAHHSHSGERTNFPTATTASGNIGTAPGAEIDHARLAHWPVAPLGFVERSLDGCWGWLRSARTGWSF